MREVLLIVALFVSVGAAFGRPAQPAPHVEMRRPVGVVPGMQGADIEALAFLVMMQAAASATEDLKAIVAQVKAANEAKKANRRLAASKQLRGNACAATGGVAWHACAKRIENEALRLQLGALDVMKAAAAEAEADARAMLEAMNRSRNAKTSARERAPRLQELGNPCAGSVVQAWRQCLARIDARLAGNVVDDRTKAELDGLVAAVKNDIDSASEMGEMESLRLQMAMDRMSKMMSTLSNLMKKISDTANTITQNLK